MKPEEIINAYKATVSKSEKDKFANELMGLIIKTPICNKWQFSIADLPDEIWLPVMDYEGLYEISNYGRLKHLAWETTYHKRRDSINPKVKYREKICEYKMGLPHYARTVLVKEDNTKFRVSIHVLVAKHFVPNPLNLPEVNHKDGVKRHNHYLNLEWSTHLDNMKHALVTGLRKGKIIDSTKAMEIFKNDKSNAEIAAIFNIPTGIVYSIKSGRRWGWVTGMEFKPKNKKES